MIRWIFSYTLVFCGLCTEAGAEALCLQDLDRTNLAELTVDLQELRRAKRLAVLRNATKTTEVLVKFQGLEQVRALSVDAADLKLAIGRLLAREDVAFAEPNTRLQRQFIPGDPLFGNQWHHETIGSSNAWNWSIGSADVKIAIVDAPFNLAHPDLAANAASGWDVVNEVPIFSGNDDHASMSAGMAAGVVNNGIGIAGAGNCTLVPLNNAYSDFSTDVAQMDAAIRWAADHGIRVVNLSWDGADSPTLNMAAEYLRNTIDGVVVMAGVNGAGFLNYPNQPYIIAVSMTDRSDALQSHYGAHIDFAAPGYSVYSTSANGYNSGTGTSYAAPLVSGILGALFSISPSLSADEAISILKATAADLGTPGWDQFYGWGRVDFKHAAWLVAAATGAAAHLGEVQFKTDNTNLMVSTEFHPGVDYELMGSTNLNPAVWAEVPARLQTNGTMVQFTVEPGAGAAFYKIDGKLDF